VLSSWSPVVRERSAIELALRQGDPTQKLIAMLDDAPIKVPFADRLAFVNFAWGLESSDLLRLPPELELPVQRVPPRGRMRMLKASGRGERQRRYVAVDMGYEGNWVELNAPRRGVLDRREMRILERDRAAERRLLEKIAQIGVFANKAHHAQQSGSHHFQEKLFERVTFALLSDGWLVEIEDEPVRGPGRFNVSISSGIDWLDLDGSVDFDGTSVGLPELLSAVRKGQATINLADGSVGILPDAWRARHSALASLAELDGDRVRYRPAQTLLLDALLSDEVADTRVDADYAQWRERFSRFEGIDEKPVPAGFCGELRPYQHTGYNWLRFLREFRFGGCLADDMGLGKTVQVLALLAGVRADSLAAGRECLPSLVVVPKSLVFNWLAESARFTPELKTLEYSGNDRAKLRSQFKDIDLVVVTYGILRQDISELSAQPFEYAILDESQAIKNPRSQTAKAARLIDAAHRLVVTGTPIENHLGELWSQFEFLNPGLLGSLDTFESLSRADGDGESRDVLGRGLRPFILRRTKAQVAPELPPKTEQTVYCELEGEQRRQYEELLKFYRARIGNKVSELGFGRAKVHVLEALLRLRQTACHPGLVDKDRAQDSSAKIDLLLEQIDDLRERGHKALVFSQFTSLLAIVRHHLDTRGLVYEYLDGKTRDREARVQRFQEDADCGLFLISLKAGGSGLNLTAADYVFILDPWWNPAVEAQAIDRSHRIGQTKPVFAYRLIARDTVEERIIELQKQKRALADAIIGEDNAVIRDLTKDDLEFLLG
ncbi:MAG: DEAD/DEAH box helicase, partial [Gammaproteobacteria bacterium]|nr:DEAD/DEAH box helicase [Gammaproteobacteria bacterium]